MPINSIWKKVQNKTKQKNGLSLHTIYRNQVEMITNLKIKLKIITFRRKYLHRGKQEKNAKLGVRKCIFYRMQEYEPYKEKYKGIN